MNWVRTVSDTKIPRWLAWYVDYGLAGKDKRSRRRQSTFNWVMVLLVFTSVQYSVVCFAYNAELWPTSVVGLLIGLQFFAMPFLFNISTTLTALVSATLGCGGVTIQAFLLSSASGLHIYLFLVPTIWLAALGSNQLATVLATMAIGLTGIFATEFYAHSPILPAADDAQFLNLVLTTTVVFTIGLTLGIGYIAFSRAERAEDALEAEHARSETLLYNLLPEDIAARLKVEPDKTIADSLPQVAILFADIVDFTPRSARMAPEEIVGFLNGIFSAFDELGEKHGLEKIKTIGDAYMVAAGMPNPCGDPVHRVAEMALDMLKVTAALPDGVEVRIGLHAGPAVAGVIGNRKLFYDVWGETVNTASRMESHGEGGRIQVTAAARAELADRYVFEPRGTVEVKGMGEIETWWLTGKA